MPSLSLSRLNIFCQGCIIFNFPFPEDTLEQTKIDF